MSYGIMLDLLKETWLSYLLRQGHRMTGVAETIVVIRSQNGSRRSYRWFLMTCDEPIRTLSREDRLRLRKEVGLASRSREKLYVVVGFTGEPRRVVVIPASSAVAAGLVRSDRGGIAWED